ncbi:MAG: hypothetical protein R2752_08235 [Vicinamibacterales bacterium]
MPDWLPYVIVFVAGWVIGRLTGRSDGAPRIPDPPLRPLPDHALAEIQTLMREGKKIDAIKVYRMHTGGGLKVSKEAVEAIQERMG